MEPLRIARPVAYAEGEEIEPEVYEAYRNRVQMMNQPSSSRKRKRNEISQVNGNQEIQEEVWEVPLNLFNVTEFIDENESKTPLSVKRNITWANKPPTTPKEQKSKPKNMPPKLRPRHQKKRKTRKMRKSRKQNRK